MHYTGGPPSPPQTPKEFLTVHHGHPPHRLPPLFTADIWLAQQTSHVEGGYIERPLGPRKDPHLEVMNNPSAHLSISFRLVVPF